MLSEEKKQEIKRKLKKGYPQGELFNEFLKEGLSEKEINEAMFSGNTSSDANNKSDPPVSAVIGIGLIIAGISVLSIFNNSSLGYFFLFSGVVVFVVGLFLQAERKKY